MQQRGYRSNNSKTDNFGNGLLRKIQEKLVDVIPLGFEPMTHKIAMKALSKKHAISFPHAMCMSIEKKGLSASDPHKIADSFAFLQV